MRWRFECRPPCPASLDLTKESAETLQLYGIGQSATDSFGRQCLFARKFAEAGVQASLHRDRHRAARDHHFDIKNLLPASCARHGQNRSPAC